MIDVKDFQKIDTDEKSTTLQHPKGHIIKIAHKSLSPDYKKKLDALPMNLAKGGKIHQYNPNAKGSAGTAYAQAQKASSASKVSKSSNTMPGSPTESKNNYTEPDDLGTSGPLPKPVKPISGLHVNHTEPDEVSAGARNAFYAQHGQYPPCLNTACKSHGKPHPNCRCYGPTSEAGGNYGLNENLSMNFAEGGSVEEEERYCAANRVHKKKCEYFKLGGIAEGDAPGEVPQEIQEAAAPAQEEVPAQDMAQAQAPAEVNPNQELGRAPASDTLAPATGEPATDPTAPQDPSDPVQQSMDHGAAVQDHLMKEDFATKSDIDAGHITPETYKDLFAKQDTLGKLGTLFGLVVGGFGAGLTGKENPVLGMMDKQIKNDLQAQEQSASNKQTLLKINQQNIANSAGAEMTKEQAKSLALSNTYMQMNRMALDQLVKANSKLAPGSPQRVAGDQMLAILSKNVDQKNASIAAQAGVSAAIANSVSGAGGSKNTTFMKTGFAGPEMKEMGEDIESKTIPGVGTAKVPLSSGDREQITSGMEFNNQLNKYIQWAKTHSGTLNPKDLAYGKSLAAGVQGAYRQATHGGVYKEGEQNFISKIIDDDPSKFFNSIRVLPKVQAVADQHAIRMNQILKSKGFPEIKSGSAPSSDAGSSSLTSKSGREIVIRNGKHYYK